jgi:hypothetical protein
MPIDTCRVTCKFHGYPTFGVSENEKSTGTMARHVGSGNPARSRLSAGIYRWMETGAIGTKGELPHPVGLVTIM